MIVDDLQSLSSEQLVERFVAIAVEQDRAERHDDTHRFRPPFHELEAIKMELRARHGDQRTALLPLLEHPNLQVRLQAAIATLAASPLAARGTLQAIQASGIQPQALEAAMCLWNLDRGVFKPE